MFTQTTVNQYWYENVTERLPSPSCLWKLFITKTFLLASSFSNRSKYEAVFMKAVFAKDFLIRKLFSNRLKDDAELMKAVIAHDFVFASSFQILDHFENDADFVKAVIAKDVYS